MISPFYNGGSIDIKSQVDKGTEVVIKIPEISFEIQQNKENSLTK